ncbi:nucleolar complex protein 2 [Planococcus citri]|uniref:nucleolar complex protein 2 n=1 Tax=Planococcus citri TaxID=170843 RepID=UPI0031FA0CB9
MKPKHFSKKLNKSSIPAKEPNKRIKKLKEKAPGKKLDKSNEKTLGKKLEKIDPELFEYLKQNDKKLLDCEDTDLESGESENEQDSGNENTSEGELQVEQSDSDEDGSDLDADEEDDVAGEESDDESESSSDEKVHQPPESLEVASDDSDYEEEEDDDQSKSKQSGKVTMNMVDGWEQDLQANKRNIKPLSTLVRAFHACLLRISGDSDSKPEAGGFRVDGSAVFNAVIRLCVTQVYPFVIKVLNLPSTSITKKMILNSKKWSFTKNTIRNYIVDLIKMIKNISSEDVVRVLLKNFHQMTPFASCLPTIAKPVLKQLISVWGTHTDDTVRVIAFLCILRFATTDLNTNLHTILKKMYFSFVSNSKFISQNSIATVNFMRKSLTEMFCMSDSISYNHAFLYIRQLAIHLRSAVITKKKDSIQAVYNWQFISSLQLWVDVLCKMYDKPQLNALVYPIVQIIIGCIKSIPTAQYFPLRFHCIRMLNKLSRETGVFIPTLPFVVEMFSAANMSSQHKKMSMKPMDFTYILRLSKVQMQENAFKDAVVENIYDVVLDYVAAESHRISFPETVLLLQIQLKQFLKNCKNMNYTRKMKPLLEKIDETCKTINTERSNCGIALSDEKGMAAWESNLKLKGNSLTEFHKTWVKVNEQKIKQKQIDKIDLDDYELPVLTKLPGKKMDQKKKTVKENGHMDLFSSDEDEDDDDLKFGADDMSEGGEDEEIEEKKPKKSKNKNKNKPNKGEKRKSNGNVIGASEKKKPKRESKMAKSIEMDEDKNDIVEDLDLSNF